MRESLVPWTRETFAVLEPVVPDPIRRASTTATPTPARASRRAVTSPVSPPPTTRVSTRPDGGNGSGYAGQVRSSQREAEAAVLIGRRPDVRSLHAPWLTCGGTEGGTRGPMPPCTSRVGAAGMGGRGSGIAKASTNEQ